MNRTQSISLRSRTIVVVFLLILIAGLAAAQTSGQASRGVVEYLEGDVRINGAPADFGQRVLVGDWVQTGRDSVVDIVFDRANIFRLGENTVAVLEIGTIRQEIDLKTGSLAAVFDRVRTIGGEFNIRTPTSVAGVRGTSFFLRVLSADVTYQCTCNGTLHLTPLGGEAFNESAAAHSAFTFTRSDGSVVVEQAEGLYHDNQSLNRLADSIGAVIPWGSIPQ